MHVYSSEDATGPLELPATVENNDCVSVLHRTVHLLNWARYNKTPINLMQDQDKIQRLNIFISKIL